MKKKDMEMQIKLFPKSKLFHLIFFIFVGNITMFSAGKTFSDNLFFSQEEKNQIIDNSQSLSAFFEQLKKLQEVDSSIVSITHIGDSHIQADFETKVIRNLFQQYFGNAGRGLMIPLKLAKTNEPRNYKITSPQIFSAVRCTKPGNIPFGIGGITLFLNDSLANISVENLEKDSTLSSDFTEIRIYYDSQTSKLCPADTSMIADQEIINLFTEQWILKTPRNQIDFEFYSPDKKEIIFYGVDIRNGYSGILYNVIGINGAHYTDFSYGNFFAEQLSNLGTDLFIISLGSNEIYQKKFYPDTFYKEIDRLIQLIRKHNPQATFILTTPAGSWKRISSKKRIPHPNAEFVRNTIVQYAIDNNIAYWDLYTISGGKDSAHQWSKKGLFAKDGIHFTKEGYEIQGKLFFQAIYNKYISYKK